MKSAPKRRRDQTHPKHKHTKEYLKHYYPFLPLVISIAALVMVLLQPLQQTRARVLGSSTPITQTTLLDATNNARAENNLSPLQLNTTLSNAAQAKADDMVKRNYWSHVTPDGNQPWIFIASSGYDYAKAGENLAYGFNESSEIVTGWLNSKSHRTNMLDASYKDVGFGIAQSPNFNNNGAAEVIVAMYAQPAELALTTGNQSNYILSDQSNSLRTLDLYVRNSWAAYVVGAIVGAGIMYLLITHSLTLKRAVKKGEHFIVRNPILDSIVVALIAFGLILLQNAGSIQ